MSADVVSTLEISLAGRQDYVFDEGVVVRRITGKLIRGGGRERGPLFKSGTGVTGVNDTPGKMTPQSLTPEGGVTPLGVE